MGVGVEHQVGDPGREKPEAVYDEDTGYSRHPSAGELAPDFWLPGTGDRTYSLSENAGAPTVLVFYPADNSPVCTRQLRDYSDNLEDFQSVDARVLAISPQDVETHEAFAAEHGLSIPLLADVDKAVGAAYDLLGPLGFYRRSIFVIDPTGLVVLARRSITSLNFMPVSQILDSLGFAG